MRTEDPPGVRPRWPRHFSCEGSEKRQRPEGAARGGLGTGGSCPAGGELWAELPVRIAGPLYVSGCLGRTPGRLSQNLWGQGPRSFA